MSGGRLYRNSCLVVVFGLLLMSLERDDEYVLCMCWGRDTRKGTRHYIESSSFEDSSRIEGLVCDHLHEGYNMYGRYVIVVVDSLTGKSFLGALVYVVTYRNTLWEGCFFYDKRVVAEVVMTGQYRCGYLREVIGMRREGLREYIMVHRDSVLYADERLWVVSSERLGGYYVVYWNDSNVVGYWLERDCLLKDVEAISFAYHLDRRRINISWIEMMFEGSSYR